MKKIFLPCPRCGSQPKSYSNGDDFEWYECPVCHIAASGSYIHGEAESAWKKMAGFHTVSTTQPNNK